MPAYYHEQVVLKQIDLYQNKTGIPWDPAAAAPASSSSASAAASYAVMFARVTDAAALARVLHLPAPKKRKKKTRAAPGRRNRWTGGPVHIGKGLQVYLSFQCQRMGMYGK